MDIIKNILTNDLNEINLREHRDGKPRFNSDFLRRYPYLCLAMLISYIILAVLIWYAPYFGTFSLIAFTALFLVMAAVLLFEVKPVYHFDDIGVLDLRVCYNGEWFASESISENALNTIINHPEISDTIKEEVQKIVRSKGEIHFYDVFMIAYPEKRPIKKASHWMENAA